MADLPFSMFISTVVLCLAVPLTAVYLRTKIFSSAVFFICGGIILLIPLTIDNITLGQLNTTQVYNNSTDTIENGFIPDNYPLRDSVTLEPSFGGITLLLFGICLILSGVLIEKYA